MDRQVEWIVKESGSSSRVHREGEWIVKKSGYMMASRKRLFDEFEDLESATKQTKSAKVHGLLTSLSPKKDGKYFVGSIADGTTSMRLVGFNAMQQRELAAQHDQKKPVVLVDCTIQESKFSDSMEILVTRSIKVALSPRKFTNVVTSVYNAKDITLNQLKTLQEFQTVTTTAKILNADTKLEVKPGLFKQDLCISDSTATGRLTLW